MGRGDAAKATPRIRNKITHKTRLRIVHGDIDTDRSFPDEDNDGRTLATGVDAEDANEYHLLAVLAASSQPSTFCQPTSAGQSPTNNRKTSAPVQAPSVLFIPTPDATGKVDNYIQLYHENAWQPPLSNIRTSDTVEECQTDALAGGYSYVMDERDADWLDKNNKLASGEGPSNGVPSTPRPDASARRSAKSRGKEPESSPSNAFTITEDEFELVMGLFERVTDEKMPFLHLTPTDMPLFSDFESFFGSPVPPHYFPDFLVPASFPQPAQLTKLARAIYPHWRDRKADRAGRRIIPQLNVC
ncbi:Enhancer of polycomb-like protein 1 [Tulasnella sp. 418]|nr:Enhancer of polycomb-like protein 1 [Tulasnella sp. 418]